jgi:hypothetical protein
MAVEYDTSIDSTLKGKFPKVVTVAVTFDTSASKKFEIGVAEMGRDGIPVFVSLQRIFLGDDGSFLTEAITAKDYLVAEWGAK